MTNNQGRVKNLHVTAHEGHSPAINRVRKLGADPAPAQPSDETTAMAKSINATSQEVLSLKVQPRHAWASDSQNWDNEGLL